MAGGMVVAVEVTWAAAVADSTGAADRTAAIAGADYQVDMAVDITGEPARVPMLDVAHRAGYEAGFPVMAVQARDARGRGKDTVPAIRPPVGISLHLPAVVRPVLPADQWQRVRVSPPLQGREVWLHTPPLRTEIGTRSALAGARLKPARICLR